MAAEPLFEFPSQRWGVRVREGDVPETLADVSLDEGFVQMSPLAFLVDIEHLGRMLVTRDEVVLAPAAQSTVEDMDYLVYGWAAQFVRVLRREFSVHASAVQTSSGALAIMGPATAGKSTTTMGLVRRGYALIVDDVLPVDFIEGRPQVHGWIRPLHLRDAAADHFKVARDRVVVTTLETKVQVSVPHFLASAPLRCLIELAPDPNASVVTLRRLRGTESLRACLRTTNAGGIAAADGRGGDFFTWLTKLTATVPVYRLTRPTSGWSLDAVLDAIEELSDSLGSSS